MTDLDHCDATISFGDDNADNMCTFHCELPPNHIGSHKETGEMWEFQPYTLTWDNPDPKLLPKGD